MSYSNVEAAVVSFLYAIKAIPEDWDVLSTDLGVPLNADGYIEFDMEVVKPVKKRFQIVDENYKPPVVQDNEQMTLPLEHFEKIVVKDQ